MRQFADINEVEEWLEPLDYQAFWFAVEPFNLVLQPRDHCDQQIRDGEVEQELVLEVLKYFARIELTKRHNLNWRLPPSFMPLPDEYS